MFDTTVDAEAQDSIRTFFASSSFRFLLVGEVVDGIRLKKGKVSEAAVEIGAVACIAHVRGAKATF